MTDQPQSANRHVDPAKHASAGPTTAPPGDPNGVTRTGPPFVLTPTDSPAPIATSKDDPLPPAPPGYEIRGELGRGGMGAVYRARHLALNRDVALKVVLGGRHATPELRVRFLQEAEAAARVPHANVVQVYEVGTWAGQPFLALEYCPGGNLSQRLSGTPLPPNDAAALVETLARAVQVAHDRGVVHRDLKPANILLASDGQPKVADFGLAKLTECGDGMTATGAVFGTPSYIAPEQARGQTKVIGPLVDVYALGAVLYECLTGRPPFKASSPAETLHQVLHREPAAVRAVNPLVPLDLETITLKCLEKEPPRRYFSAGDVADELRRWLDDRPILARPVGLLGQARRWARRNPAVAALLAASVFAVAAGTGATYAKYRDEATQRVLADRAATELETTLTDLESAHREQAQTVQRLAQEKAAAEDAYLDGLLRPLRPVVAAESTPSAEEVEALTVVATATDERLRVRFVMRALESPTGAAKVSAWREEVAWAVAGPDRAAGVRLRLQVGAVLRTAVKPRTRLASALLVANLPPGDPDTDGLAAEVLTDGMAVEKDPVVLDRLCDAMAGFARRLGPADAGPRAEVVVRRMLAEQDPNSVERLALVVAALSGRLLPSDAAAMCGPPARALADRVADEKGPSAARHFAKALSSLAARLAIVEAAQVCRPPASALTNQLISEEYPASVRHLTEAVASLAVWLGPTTAAEMFHPPAVALSERMSSARDPSVADALAGAVTVLTERLPAAEAAKICRTPANTFADRIPNEKDPRAAHDFAQALAALAARLEPVEAARLCGPPAHHFVRRLALNESPERVYDLAHALAALAGQLDSGEAARLCGQPAGAIVERLVGERDPTSLSQLAAGLSALSGRLVGAEAGRACSAPARAIQIRIASTHDPFARGLLVRGLHTLVARLAADELAPVLQTHWAFASIRRPALDELGRVSVGKPPSPLSEVAWPITALPASPFADVWEFADWAETHRPDLDLKSGSALPARSP